MHGIPHGLTVGAHTHRPVSVSRDTQPGGIPSDLWFANVGCLMSWDRAAYMKRLNFQGWGHACVCIDLDSRNGQIYEGRVGTQTKIWEAETRVMRLARDCM
jgi:hypothetical protein